MPYFIYISNAFDVFKNRRTLSHCLIAAMFLSIFLICLSNFSCFFFSSWIFRLYIWPHVDFQIFGEKASNEPVKYIISLVFYISNAWMASRSCVSFRSSIHDAFDSVFRWLFLQYREIETSPIVGHDLPARFEPELVQENELLLQVFFVGQYSYGYHLPKKGIVLSLVERERVIFVFYAHLAQHNPKSRKIQLLARKAWMDANN